VGLLLDAAGCRPVPLTADVGEHGGGLKPMPREAPVTKALLP
jgi:hypothetical protein